MKSQRIGVFGNGLCKTIAISTFAPMETEFNTLLTFPLTWIYAEMYYSLYCVNGVVDGKKSIEGKHTISTHMGMCSFLENVPNLGKQET